MKHVAQAAGVSVMTVSLALRRDPSIPAATQERVVAVAAEVGYRRNPLVSVLMAALRGGTPRGSGAHVIAYVESYPATATPQQAASLQRFRAGVVEGAARHGYRVQFFRMGETGLSEARLEHVLTARGIRGVVFSPFPQTGATLQQRWENHALAVLGYSLAEPRLHRAVNHQAHAIRLALSKLIALGHRRIGVAIRRHEDERAHRYWLSAVLLARHDHAKTRIRFPLWMAEVIERRPLESWLRRERPDVVLVTDREVHGMLRGKGVGFAHLHLTSGMPGWSGIDQNNERVGTAAVDLVVEQLHGNQFGVPENPKTVLIEGRWVPGNTALGLQRGRRSKLS
ncbi:MAG: LacI family DNA-binding transcriptional regulator [Opitutaceae bacterium]